MTAEKYTPEELQNFIQGSLKPFPGGTLLSFSDEDVERFFATAFQDADTLETNYFSILSPEDLVYFYIILHEMSIYYSDEGLRDVLASTTLLIRTLFTLFALRDGLGDNESNKYAKTIHEINRYLSITSDKPSTSLNLN